MSRCFSTGTACTFAEYAQVIFLPYVLKQLNSAKRVDIVWDVYREDSLKKAARENRGSGQRRKVTPTTRIPSDWKGFLRVDDNKTELFKFLAEQVIPTTSRRKGDLQHIGGKGLMLPRENAPYNSRALQPRGGRYSFDGTCGRCKCLWLSTDNDKD